MKKKRTLLSVCSKMLKKRKSFFECFENKGQAEEYLAKCSDEKEMSEYRMNFNENERRKFGGECRKDFFGFSKMEHFLSKEMER